MQDRMFAGLITALILSSFLLSMGIDKSPTLESIDSDHSSDGSSAEIKVHRPGDLINSTETLSWYPNNISDFSTIQFTVIFRNGVTLYDITDINIIGNWFTADGLSSEQFRLEITEFSNEDWVSPSKLTRNYTYPNNIWGGDYSLRVEITQTDGETILIERSDIKFMTFGYYFNSQNDSEEIFICSCETNLISLQLTNTGEDEVTFSYLLNLNETLPNIKVEWSEESETNTQGELFAGESIILTISVKLNPGFDYPDNLEIPIYLEVEYAGDGGQRLFLSNQQVYFGTTVLSDHITPQVNFRFANTDYQVSLPKSLPQPINDIVNETLFTYDQDFFLLEVNLTNLGFYNQELRIKANNPDFRYMVMYNDGNYSLTYIKNNQIQVNRQQSIEFEIYVGNLGTYEDEVLSFEFTFNNSLTTLASFDIAPKPIISNDVFATTTSYDSAFELPVNHPQSMEINLSEYIQYASFDNHWLLVCNYPAGVGLSESLSGEDCSSQGINIQFDDKGEYLRDLEFVIDITEELPNNNALIEFNLTPIIPGLVMSPWHSTSITLLIEVATNETDGEDSANNDPENNTNTTDNNDALDENESSNTNNTDATNNTTEDDSNSTIDANTDTDGDGVIDTLDACPNTASGITVDEFGCQVIEQDIDDEQDNMTANPTEAEGNSEQRTDDAATQTDENNVVKYLIIGAIAMAIVGALLFLNSRRSVNQTEPSTKTLQPIAPLPTLPLPSMEPVVLQQWTDANGYSWRQMSDQSIMWWNGSDWIPYGKN